MLKKILLSAIAVIALNGPASSPATAQAGDLSRLDQSCKNPIDAGPIGRVRSLSPDEARVAVMQAIDQSIPALERARLRAHFVFTAENERALYSRVWSSNPWLSVSERHTMGWDLAKAGEFEAAIPLYECFVYSPLNGPSEEWHLVRTIAAAEYRKVFGNRGDSVASLADFIRSYMQDEQSVGISQRAERALVDVAIKYGVSSREYYVTELLAAANIFSIAPYMGLPALENANARSPDARLTRFIAQQRQKLIGTIPTPLVREKAQQASGGDLFRAEMWMDFEEWNASKSLMLLQSSDLVGYEAHAKAVAAIYATQLAPDRSALQRAGATPSYSASVAEVLNGQRRWLQDSQTFAAAGRNTAQIPEEVAVRSVSRLMDYDDAIIEWQSWMMNAMGAAAQVRRTETDRYLLAVAAIRSALLSGAPTEEIQMHFDALQREAPSLGRWNADARWLVAMAPSVIARREGRLLTAKGLASQVKLRAPASPEAVLPATYLPQRLADVAVETGERRPAAQDLLRYTYTDVILECTNIRSLYAWMKSRSPNAFGEVSGIPMEPYAWTFRRTLCDQEDRMRALVRGGDLKAASRVAETMASYSGRRASFGAWRRSTLLEFASQLYSSAGDFPNAQRVASEAALVRAQAKDPVTDGALPQSESVLQSLRISAIGRQWPAATPQQKANLLQQAVSLIEHMPRPTAAKALDQLSHVTTAGVDNAVRSFITASKDLEIARTNARKSAGTASEASSIADLQTRQRQRDDSVKALSRAHPLLSALSSAPPAPEIGKIQAVLKPDERLVILQLFSASNGAGIVIGPKAVNFVELPATVGTVYADLKALRASVSSPSARGDFDGQPAYRLYRGLLEPLQSSLDGARQLIIVPDLNLDAVPWNALLTQQPGGVLKSNDLRGAPWLAKKFAVQTVPSASALVALRSTKWAPARGEFVGVGSARFLTSPTSTPLEKRLAALPTIASDEELALLDATLGSGTGKRILVGDAAREPNLINALKQSADYIAFSTHGIMAGELSGLAEPSLVLTSGGQTAPNDDGLLRASEIASLRLNAQLVILAACNTASGSGEPGSDSMSGMINAFYLAGARNVLATYWAADSSAALEYLTELGNQIFSNTSISVAAQRSANAVLSSTVNPKHAHPYYWATFGLFGAS